MKLNDSTFYTFYKTLITDFKISDLLDTDKHQGNELKKFLNLSDKDHLVISDSLFLLLYNAGF